MHNTNTLSANVSTFDRRSFVFIPTYLQIIPTGCHQTANLFTNELQAIGLFTRGLNSDAY